jgi:hypothetical protein
MQLSVDSPVTRSFFASHFPVALAAHLSCLDSIVSSIDSCESLSSCQARFSHVSVSVSNPCGLISVELFLCLVCDCAEITSKKQCFFDYDRLTESGGSSDL